MELVRDVRRVADQLELVLDDVENAAALEARRGFLIVEAHRDVDVHLAVLADAQEVDVDRAAADRVEVHGLGKSAVRLAADLDHHHRVHEVAGREHPGEELLLDMHRQRLLLVAVDHGGYPAVAAQCTGGSLASPFARFGGQRQLFAHSLVPSKGLSPRHASRDDHGRERAPIGEVKAVGKWKSGRAAATRQLMRATRMFALASLLWTLSRPARWPAPTATNTVPGRCSRFPIQPAQREFRSANISL